MSEHEKTLTEYINELESEDANVRIEAAVALGDWGNDRAVTPLIEALFHPDENLRRESARALKEISNRRSVEPLITVLLDDTSAEVRAEAAFALGYFTRLTFEIDGLLQALKDEHYLVRQNVAFALGRIKRRKAVKDIISILQNDENYHVREMAAWALGEIRDKRAIEALISAFNDERITVRKNAAYALGRIQDNAATEALKLQVVREGESKDASWALSKILKKKDALAVLKDAYKKMRKENLIDDCIEICRTLFNIDSRTAEKYLKEMSEDEDLSQYYEKIKSVY
ncbi:MAG: HEAT repeat domain-containing protein [Asgard group archaeon]|nr:HEAT repeat domain-containing protein [Asgard group archaeon]